MPGLRRRRNDGRPAPGRFSMRQRNCDRRKGKVTLVWGSVAISEVGVRHRAELRLVRRSARSRWMLNRIITEILIAC
jgi:hypothetical protein